MDNFSRSKTSRESVVEQPSNCAQSPPNLDYKIKDVKIKKVNSCKILGVNLDPEFSRKKRVAGYKAYDMESKMKGSVKGTFRWIKHTCNQIIHGFGDS